MAKFSSQQRFPVPVAELFAAHTDPKFQEAKALALGSTTAAASRRDEADGTIIIAIDTTEPPRWGSDPQAGTMTYRLDPKALRGTWTRVQKGFEKKARAEGTIVFRDAGGGRSEVTVDGVIEIKVPIMGKMIEKKIVAAIAEQQPKEEAIAADLLRQRTGAAS